MNCFRLTREKGNHQSQRLPWSVLAAPDTLAGVPRGQRWHLSLLRKCHGSLATPAGLRQRILFCPLLRVAVINQAHRKTDSKTTWPAPQLIANSDENANSSTSRPLPYFPRHPILCDRTPIPVGISVGNHGNRAALLIAPIFQTAAQWNRQPHADTAQLCTTMAGAMGHFKSEQSSAVGLLQRTGTQQWLPPQH